VWWIRKRGASGRLRTSLRIWGLKRRAISRELWLVPHCFSFWVTPSPPLQLSLFHWSFIATLKWHEPLSRFNYKKCNTVFVQKPTWVKEDPWGDIINCLLLTIDGYYLRQLSCLIFTLSTITLLSFWSSV